MSDYPRCTECGNSHYPRLGVSYSYASQVKPAVECARWRAMLSPRPSFSASTAAACESLS